MATTSGGTRVIAKDQLNGSATEVRRAMAAVRHLRNAHKSGAEIAKALHAVKAAIHSLKTGKQDSGFTVCSLKK